MDRILNFEYFLPTRLVFGVGSVNRVGEFAKSLGKKALIVTGKSSTKKTGLLDRVIAVLEKNGIETVVFDEIVPNPLSSTVD
ncbi:MAG: iron-containing alcohol dehydrogenase, partial [Mesotoga sp.]|uniref:iron-containing alcohol dehydrogenase n=1 Tax=Mesotoga sp. TaxID=2053577 RepID=UPI0035657638